MRRGPARASHRRSALLWDGGKPSAPAQQSPAATAPAALPPLEAWQRTFSARAPNAPQPPARRRSPMAGKEEEPPPPPRPLPAPPPAPPHPLLPEPGPKGAPYGGKTAPHCSSQLSRYSGPARDVSEPGCGGRKARAFQDGNMLFLVTLVFTFRISPGKSRARRIAQNLASRTVPVRESFRSDTGERNANHLVPRLVDWNNYEPQAELQLRRAVPVPFFPSNCSEKGVQCIRITLVPLAWKKQGITEISKGASAERFITLYI